ncbi:T9SS type A sorting domain-containing protein [uncultured Draconibacterium sp.]|uniref:T9SS type A sorting domain-containing protein n=1 Tax=uncultured Draconibacterium sp. TaxID=1573823 RepID=UPI003216D543
MKNFTLLLIVCLTAFLGNAQEATFNWEQKTLCDGNKLQKMTINEDYAAIAGNGNTFVTSSNGGETWNSLNLMKPYYSLTDISIKNSVGYVVTTREKLYDADQDPLVNGVLLKTTNEGATWSVIDTIVFEPSGDPSLSPSAEKCFGLDYTAVATVNDTVAYCAARWYEYEQGGKEDYSGIFKTSDGGSTWNNISGDLGGTSMSCIVFNGETGFTGGSKQLYRISTATDSLVDIYSQLPYTTSSTFIYDIDFVSESEVLFTTTRDSIFTSSDLGESFDIIKGAKGATDIAKINDSTIVLTSSKYLYVSTDNGNNWNSTSLPLTLWEIGCVANDSLFLLAKAAIYKFAVSDVLSGNYVYSTQNVGDNNLQKTYVNGDKIIIIGNDLNFLASDDAGISWNPLSIPEIPSLNEIYDNIDFYGLSSVGDEAYASVNRHYLVDYPSSSDKNDIYWSGGVFYTDDNWATYKSVDIAKLGKANEDDPSANPYHEFCNGVNTSVIHYVGNNVVLLWVDWFDYTTAPKTEHSRVFKSVDAGKNWTPVTDDLGTKYVKEIQSKGDTVYIVGKETLLVSYTAGVDSIENTTEFTNLYPNLDKDDNEMYLYTITLGSDNEFFITTSNDSCWVTKDGGITFETIGNMVGAYDFYKFDHNSYIMMGTKGSIFTNDGGETWTSCDPGKVIYEIGGVYNDKFYALATGDIFTNDIDNFELTTAIPTLLSKAELNVFYEPTAVKLVSTEGDIERCAMYSITGKLVSLTEPNSQTKKFNTSEFPTGIYIVNTIVKGKRYINKISIK